MLKKLIVQNAVGISLLLMLTSCLGESSKEPHSSNGEEIDSIEVIDPGIDYESEELLAKFLTDDIAIPDSLSFYDEVKKIDRGKNVNYSALDTLIKIGIDVNAPLYYESSGGGFGFGFKFSLRGGFKKSGGSGTRMGRETSAMKIALRAYETAVIFESPIDENSTEKCFDLIHFLLSRGANPNESGLEPLYNCIQKISRDFSGDESDIRDLLDVYTFYGFEMNNLDLSASDNRQELLEFLISEGALKYDMNTFKFESDLIEIYDQQDYLRGKGVIFDFSEIDGNTFPFENDTTSLIMLLEMGLSPDHITPEGIALKNDFKHFAKEGLTRTLNQWVADHPE